MKARHDNDTFNRILKKAVPTAWEDGKVVTANANIPVELLDVDARYQRERDPKTYRKLINTWDVRKYTPVVVVPHVEDGKFFLIDGQGRWKAATVKGIKELNATILMDPVNRKWTDGERLLFEAELFAEQNTAVHKLCEVEKQKARELRGDKAAIAIKKTCEQYCITMTRSQSGLKNPGQCTNYKSVYDIAKASDGTAELDFIFGILRDAKYNTVPGAYTRNIIRPMHTLYLSYSDGTDKVRRILVSELRKFPPKMLVRNASEKYAGKDFPTAVALYLDDAIANRLHQPVAIKRY